MQIFGGEFFANSSSKIKAAEFIYAKSSSLEWILAWIVCKQKCEKYMSGSMKRALGFSMPKQL